jgi:5-methylcytosine-specific restriction endonuclease McrA
MRRTKLKRYRIAAFREQRGRCYYCKLPMWEVDPKTFASKHGLTLRQGRQLRSTAEHLQARSEGGSDERSNIVAACSLCNRSRHRPKRPKAPEVWRVICRRRAARIYPVALFHY